MYYVDSYTTENEKSFSSSKIRIFLKSFLYVFLKFITTLIYPFCILRFRSNKFKGIPILLYHRVCPIHRELITFYSPVSPEEFELQMKWLKENGYNSLSFRDFRAIKDGRIPLPSKSVIITFDDGFYNNYKYAFPILKKYQVKATIFVVTGYMGSQDLFPFVLRNLDGNAKNYIRKNKEDWLPLNWNNIIDMMSGGIDFGLHTHSHPRLSQLSGDELRKEITQAKEMFLRNTKKETRLFSIPYGSMFDYNKETLDILQKEGFDTILTSKIGSTRMNENNIILKRIIIRSVDSLFEFKKKIIGTYDWVGCFQKIWLKIFPYPHRNEKEDY